MLAALALLVALNAISRADGATRAAASRTPVATTRVAVIADGSYFYPGEAAEDQWSLPLARRLGVAVDLQASGSHGYLATGADSFAGIAGQLSPDTRVLLLVGGAGPAADPTRLAAACSQAVSAARQAAPGVRVLVVARPALSGRGGATDGALRSAALASGATWIDASSWFESSGLVSDGTVTRTGVAQAEDGFAEAIEPLIR